METELPPPPPLPLGLGPPLQGASTCNGTPRPSVKMEGYLEKRGEMRVLSMWKRYWFVLEGRLLLYFKSQQEYARLSPCRGSLNMGLASCVRPGPDRDSGHVLEVVLRSHIVTLRAKDRGRQELWLKALLDSMALPCVLSPTRDTKGPLHFRYPSADNLNTPDQSQLPCPCPGSGPVVRSEKHRTLPHWKRSGELDELDDVTPPGRLPPPPAGFGAPRCRPHVPAPGSSERRGSILNMLHFTAVHPEYQHTPCGFGTKDARRQLNHCCDSVNSTRISPLQPPPERRGTPGTGSKGKGKDKCSCRSRLRMSFREEEKENVVLNQERHASCRSDENQNQLIAKEPCQDLLHNAGMDLSSLSLEKQPAGSSPVPGSGKPVRCTSAGELRCERPRREQADEEMDVEYFSAGETRSSCRGPPPSCAAKGGSARQRVKHGEGEYVKYSEPEDCEKRDSTFNTTMSSTNCDKQYKSKIRLRKRKGSTSKESGSYNLTDCGTSCAGSAEKKRAPLRNRLSFLSRVLSRVRRARPDEGEVLDAEPDLDCHPDMHTRCTTTTAAHLFTEVKKMDSISSSQGASPVAASFDLHSVADVPRHPGEAPEEPPPDYDSVHVDSITDSPHPHPVPLDEPPQLPPRHMKRPRSPWHDVPTNNSPVVDMDGEARQRLLSAAKHGKVIGTRGHCVDVNVDVHDWGSINAYEIVSDDSPVGSNEHLAIYLSSESSDDELFHEEVVLRKSFEQKELIFDSEVNGKRGKSALLGPLTINTQDLPTIDSSGRVNLSHAEAVKLSLLIQAQRASSESIQMKKRDSEIDSQQNVGASKEGCIQEPPAEFSDNIILRLENRESGRLGVAAELLQISTDHKITSLQNVTHEESLTGEKATFGDGKDKISDHGWSCHESQVNCLSNGNQSSSGGKKLSHEVPPQLPEKSKNSPMPPDPRPNKTNHHHSDELNTLLAQLANMTTAPLLPVGATCSLQVNRTCGSDNIEATQKQVLSLDAMMDNLESEPDYDVPRPHTSLLHSLTLETHYLELSNVDKDIDQVNGAASLSSGHESPIGHCIADDQSWSGHMSPDSLDFPLSLNQSASRDIRNIVFDESGYFHSKQSRGRKDRSRRATLNGPLAQHPFSCKQNTQEALLVRRNSAEFLSVNVPDVRIKDFIMSNVDRRINKPKQMCVSTSCEHNSRMPHQSRYSSQVSDFCRKFDLSASLENISERSESERAESLTVRPEMNSLPNRHLPKTEDVDMDSLEVTELKRLELEPSGLVSITEECDIRSDRSETEKCVGFHVNINGREESSSDSTSEGALICEGNSDSKATDQQTTHSTDSDMDMSEDETNERMEEDTTSTLIEPDSLLHDSTVDLKCTHESRCADRIKDASLEADSLELKK